MNNNINEIAELLNEYMQKEGDNTSVKFFQTDGKWWYMDEEEDIHEVDEEFILSEVLELWDEFLVDITRFSNGFCNAEAAWGSLIDKFTDHEETPMERFLMDEMTSEQRADAYLKYINSEFCDELQKLQVMTQY